MAENDPALTTLDQGAARARRTLRRSALFCAAVFLANAAGARLLDALGLTESLLSTHPARAALAAALGLAFFVARLLAYFVAPALAIAALAVYIVERRRRS